MFDGAAACGRKLFTDRRHAFYLAAAFQIRTKWIGALFTYVRHSVLPRHSYDLASYYFFSAPYITVNPKIIPISPESGAIAAFIWIGSPPAAIRVRSVFREFRVGVHRVARSSKNPA